MSRKLEISPLTAIELKKSGNVKVNALKFLHFINETQSIEERICFLEREIYKIKTQVENSQEKNIKEDIQTAASCAKTVDDAFRRFLNPNMMITNDESSCT